MFPQITGSVTLMVRLADLACETYVDRLAREYREIVMAACSVEGIELYARFRSER